MPTTYKILSNILLSRLIPYAKEIIRDYQCGFQQNRSTTDHIFCIHQVLEKKWEYNEEVHQLFIDFKKAYDSVRREILYKILIEFGIPRKPAAREIGLEVSADKTKYMVMSRDQNAGRIHSEDE